MSSYFVSPLRLYAGYCVLFGFACLACPSHAGTITWDGGGNGTSIFLRTNWTAIDGLPGTDAPVGFTQGGQDIEANAVAGGAAVVGGASGGTGNFDLGDTFSLILVDNATFRLNGGIRGETTATPNEGLAVSNSADVFATFLINIDATLSDEADLSLSGGGVPINASTIDVASDWSGSIFFPNKTVADILGTEINSITVAGSPAVAGVNVAVESDGNVGSIVTLIPEPASLAMLAALGVIASVKRSRLGR